MMFLKVHFPTDTGAERSWGNAEILHFPTDPGAGSDWGNADAFAIYNI